MPPDSSTGTVSPVSNKKIRSCNKNILLWRIFEHGNKKSWDELELKKLYEHEVQPFGYKFCFYGIVRLLFYESYVLEPKSHTDIKSGMGNVTVNEKRIKLYVTKFSPNPPPPARTNAKSSQNEAFQLLQTLFLEGTAQNPVPIREEKLLEKFFRIAPRIPFPDFLQCMLDKGILVRLLPTEPNKLVFQVELVKATVKKILTKEKFTSPNPKKAPKATKNNATCIGKSPMKTNKPAPAPAENRSPPNTKTQKKTDYVVKQLMRESNLVSGARYEWSNATGESLNKNRKTFINQCWAFRMDKDSPASSTSTCNGIFYPQDSDYCSDCAISFDNNEQLEVHKDTDEHKFVVFYGQHRGKGSNLSPPKEMSGQTEGITIQSTNGGEGCDTYVVQFIMGTEEHCQQAVHLDVVFAPPSDRNENLSLVSIFTVVCDDDMQIDSTQLPLKLAKGQITMRTFTFDCSHPGFREYVLAFKFSVAGNSGSREIFVMKKLNIRTDNSFTIDEDVPGATVHQYPTFNASHMKDENDYNIIEPPLVEQGEFPPLPKNSLRMVHKLKDYPLPWKYIRFFNYGFSIGPDTWISTLKKMQSVLDCFDIGLVAHNYSAFFQLLLFLEEHQNLCDLRVYALTDTTLEKSRSGGNNFYLSVPGLAEKRPSVLPCDAIYITTEVGVYKGFVNLVELTRVRFSMGPSFARNFEPKMKVSVHFSFNRSCLKVQHRALEMINEGQSLRPTLFPKEFGKFKQNIPITLWFNPNINNNPPQRQAVQNILNGTSLPAPFLLFGPPGTGKTVTIVESIKQVYLLKKQSHILAVAPSNSAADLLAIKILDSISSAHVIRLYSPSRNASTVPQQLQHISNYKGKECVFPALQYLKQFRIIVCTMICAGRLYSGNFPAGYFSHIFIDECGHGMEPNALVPIAGLQGSPKNPTQVVLSGDPKQLGPIVRSPVALAMGLGDSLLVRLMDSVDIYQKNGSYNPEVLAKLTYNYRSHPQILKVPNNLFYDGDLVPCGDAAITASACDLPWLPQKGFPLIFHGVNGKDEQSPTSPSFFNTAEVYEVIKYVKKVLSSTFNGKLLRQVDIGVVSPYRGQLNKISRALKNNGMPEICVGSVEEFQGQERRAIIISTVRSNPAQLKLDQKFSLGFVREPRRFNVAVTRASALLIVIGNPHLLQTDPNWRTLLEHIFVNGGYTHTNCPFKLGPPVNYSIINPNQQLLNIRQKLAKQMEVVKRKINEMEGGSNDGEAEPVTESNVDELISQIRRLNFFTEDGPMDQNDDN